MAKISLAGRFAFSRRRQPQSPERRQYVPYWHALTPFGSTTRIGFICTLLGGNIIVSVIWYSAQEAFFLATAWY